MPTQVLHRHHHCTGQEEEVDPWLPQALHADPPPEAKNMPNPVCVTMLLTQDGGEHRIVGKELFTTMGHIL